MLRSGLEGPYSLQFDVIAARIAERCPGVFALGYIDLKGRFCISYVGHAFEDVGRALLSRIGTAAAFKVRFDADPHNVFDAACGLFHDFRPVGNMLHPERRLGTNWRCQRCTG
jgi:hypothetical protein